MDSFFILIVNAQPNTPCLCKSFYSRLVENGHLMTTLKHGHHKLGIFLLSRTEGEKRKRKNLCITCLYKCLQILRSNTNPTCSGSTIGFVSPFD